MTTVGIIGVGSLGHAITTGLVRDVPDPPVVVLSPRGRTAADDLSATYPSVSVADDNQGVVDAADVVVVCLRERDAAALGELSWRDGQVAISAVAGLSPKALADAVAPATIARAVPMVGVAERAWATPVRPPVPEAMALFERIGGAIPLETDEAYDALFTGLGTAAPFFEYLGVIEGFLVDHGLQAVDARRLLGDAFAMVAAPLGGEGEPDFAAMLRSHATPGGGNEQLATLMREAGVPEATRRALDEVLARQTGGSA